MNATSTVRILGPSTGPYRVEDVLHDMTDGTFVVIAVEVFDHPSARPATKAEAARWQVDEGQTLGTWVLGRPDDVHAHLAAEGWEDYDEQYAQGYDSEEGDGVLEEGS